MLLCCLFRFSRALFFLLSLPLFFLFVVPNVEGVRKPVNQIATLLLTKFEHAYQKVFKMPIRTNAIVDQYIEMTINYSFMTFIESCRLIKFLSEEGTCSMIRALQKAK